MSLSFPFRRSQKRTSRAQLARAARRRVIAASLAPFVVIPALAAIPLASGGATAAAATAVPAQQINMKVLVITDSTDSTSASGIAYADWINTLKREGVPYDTLVTDDTNLGSVALPTLSTTAADGTEVANYEGVVVATSGTEGLSPAQWTTLQTFEQHFSVRQVTAYASPSSDQGLSGPMSTTLDQTSALSLTADGSGVFPYLKSVALDAGSYGYEATPLAGDNVDTLISGPNSSTVLGIYTTTDGRQTMFQTFNENQYMLQSELLRHGELNWLTRDTYFGDQRNYLETDIDDNFLADDVWSVAGNATTSAHSTDFTAADAIREVPSDVAAAASWSATNNFRIDMLFNGGGSTQFAAGCTEASSGDGGSGGTGTDCGGAATGTDPLLAGFQANDPATGKPYTDDFSWINHTWDHPNIDEGCATTNYIEAEINQNTAWGSTAASAGNPTAGGLGLTQSTTTALGAENPSVVVTGEHSGLANLIPGNPGQVDPPAFDTQNANNATGGTLAAGEYVYAVADQFNTAAPGATPVPAAPASGNTTEESAASITSPVTVTAGETVPLSWGAVCKAADYVVYRAPYTPATAPATGGTIGAYVPIGVVGANTTSATVAGDFANPKSTSDTTNGGAITKTFTDTGSEAAPTLPAGASATPLTEGTAIESPYEQNPNLDTAFAGTTGGGIKYFGADASKPYPLPGDTVFGTGAFAGTVAAGTEAAATSAFPDAGATGIPRYPTNIYYNVSTNAEEVDEYNTLYLPTSDGGQCAAPRTDCFAAGTAPATIKTITDSVDSNMFLHMMGNDPRPHYFHQSNLMSAQTANDPTGDGDGLYYETMNPLLAQYHQYFQDNAPIEQLTTAQIGDLLNQQSTWAAGQSGVTGSIKGNVVTVNNSGKSAIELPLTGITGVGSVYGGTQSGWTSANVGTTTYTALAAWPALPTVPVAVQPPTGTAPGTSTTPLPGPAPAPATPTTTPTKTTTTTPAPPAKRVVKPPVSVRRVVQVRPKTVGVKRGNKVMVSLKCEATKGQVCTGSFTVKLAGKTRSHTFRIKANKIERIAAGLPKYRWTVRHGHRRPLHATLRISSKQSSGSPRITRGALTITG